MEGAVPLDQFEEVKSIRSPKSPHIREICKNFIARIGKGGRKHYNSTGDFSYDPMSYALNFEDDSSRANDFPIVNFTSRLPATPERTSEVRTSVSARREVFAYS